MILTYFIHLLILIGIYFLVAISLNLVMGYSGLLNLGHIAFFGIGAYTSALLTFNGIPFLLSFLISGVIASIFGIILVYGTRKIKGDYFALVTLGFAFVIYSLLINLNFTRGPLGISAIPKPEILGISLSSGLSYLIFVLIICVLSYLFIKKILKSSLGKMFEALRENELYLRILGKNSSKLKYYSMGIGAFFAGLAGSLFAHYLSYINPSNFYIEPLILIITMVILGGLASINGTFLGVLIIILIPEFLKLFNLPVSVLGPMRQIFYALILIIILWFKPKGIFGRVNLK